MLVPSAIVFDLDGTLIDSRGDIVAAMNHALTVTGRMPLPGPVIIRNVGDGARMLCAKVARLPEKAEEVDRLLAHFVAYYVEHPVDFTRWTPGAQEALEQLVTVPDLALAVCTNKARPITDVILATLGVIDVFKVVVAGGDLPEKKPAPEPLLHIVRALGLEPASVVMVGDGPQDVECARKAGARSIVVDSPFGHYDKAMNARPDGVLRSLSDLPDAVRRWRAATVRIPPKIPR